MLWFILGATGFLRKTLSGDMWNSHFEPLFSCFDRFVSLKGSLQIINKFITLIPCLSEAIQILSKFILLVPSKSV